MVSIFTIDQHRFDQFMQESLDELPKKLRDALSNVAFVIEGDARIAQSGEVQISRGSILLGLYQGVPQSQWGRGGSGQLPDKITIFKNSIQSIARDEPHLKEMIRDVVWHEIGHHFGFVEADLRAIESRRKNKTKE